MLELKEYEQDGLIKFVFESAAFDFEYVLVAIKECLHPDEIDDQWDITSWSCGTSFVKNGLTVYFYDFSDVGETEPKTFYFELYPFERHSDSDNARLREWVQTLIAYLDARILDRT